LWENKLENFKSGSKLCSYKSYLLSDFQTNGYKKVQLPLGASTIHRNIFYKKKLFFCCKTSSKQWLLSRIVRHYTSGVFGRTTQ